MWVPPSRTVITSYSIHYTKLYDFAVEEVADAAGPGNVLILEIIGEQVCEVFTGFGEWRVSAEKVADQTSYNFV